MSLVNREKGKNIVIIGAGGTLSDYKVKILSFIKKNKALVIGINKMTSVVAPTYHLWTNKQRWGKYGSCVSSESNLLFGPSIAKKLVRKHYRGAYDKIDYVDKKGIPFDYKGGQIRGHFRTAGVLAVAIAHVMGAKNIFIAGMDGYTLHNKKSLKKNKGSQHCYGSGHTDDSTWKECVEKDNIVYGCLRELYSKGIRFSIITPTVFDKFHKNKI
tara:strand:- start:6178 stop:6819 length:642 start_codon:yes stop_codon:yes gene_type:complete